MDFSWQYCVNLGSWFITHVQMQMFTGHTVLGEGSSLWEFSIPSAQFSEPSAHCFCKPKTALKLKAIKNRYIRI